MAARSARAVGSLSHPHIVPVFEADEDAGRPYLVFEYAEGATLAQRRRERPKWPVREAAQLMLGVLDALAAAHAQGVMHRDLKPFNVLLGGDGRARVKDFGIAARVAVASAAPSSACATPRRRPWWHAWPRAARRARTFASCRRPPVTFSPPPAHRGGGYADCRQRHFAGSFLLLPLALKGVPIALIYADSDVAGGLESDGAQLNALRALRDAIVAGFACGAR